MQAGEPFTPASNQYALACILLEMLSGERIPPGSAGKEIHPWLQHRIEAVKNLPTPIPWQAIPTLRRALAEDPKQRFATIGEFASEPTAWRSPVARKGSNTWQPLKTNARLKKKPAGRLKNPAAWQRWSRPAWSWTKRCTGQHQVHPLSQTTPCLLQQWRKLAPDYQ